MCRVYSHDLSVNSIAKRDQIRAWSKDGKEYVEGTGHWDTNDGVYMNVEEGTIHKDKDVELRESEWNIYVMVKFQSGPEKKLSHLYERDTSPNPVGGLISLLQADSMVINDR